MKLKAKKIDLEAGEMTVVLNKRNAEKLGMRSQGRVKVSIADKKIIALVETSSTLVKEDEIGVLHKVSEELEVEGGEELSLVPTKRPESIDHIKEKLEGKELNEHAIREIIDDIAEKRLSDIELSAYVCGIYSHGMNIDETKNLTMAMIDSGVTIEFDKHPIFD
ncbi:MAG: thymidine phosphorylase, partial [Thermoplasmata archaeon]